MYFEFRFEMTNFFFRKPRKQLDKVLKSNLHKQFEIKPNYQMYTDKSLFRGYLLI